MKAPLLALASLLVTTACAPMYGTRVDDSAGRPTAYQDPRSQGAIRGGVGIESQDIVSMTDQMMRDMLATPALVNRSTPAKVVIDSSDFRNDSSARIDKDLITNRLRVELNRSAAGRMVFIGRRNIAAVEAERELRDKGIVDQGTRQAARATRSWDFKLVGSLNSQDLMNTAGDKSRYQQVTFEMIDINGELIWSGMYEMSKVGRDDVIYR